VISSQESPGGPGRGVKRAKRLLSFQKVVYPTVLPKNFKVRKFIGGGPLAVDRRQTREIKNRQYLGRLSRGFFITSDSAVTIYPTTKKNKKNKKAGGDYIDIID
jgi:hypothetical protein